jgi:hypothetical protein
MKSISSSSSSSLPLASLPLGRSARYWLMAAGVVRRVDLKKVKNKDEIVTDATLTPNQDYY